MISLIFYVLLRLTFAPIHVGCQRTMRLAAAERIALIFLLAAVFCAKSSIASTRTQRNGNDVAHDVVHDERNNSVFDDEDGFSENVLAENLRILSLHRLHDAPISPSDAVSDMPTQSFR